MLHLSAVSIINHILSGHQFQLSLNFLSQV